MRISDWSSDVCSSDLAIVLHRYWGLVFGEGAPRAVDKASAEIAFNEVIRDLADAASGKRLLVENVGHYSLLPRDGRNYLSGPLYHFFPWEIASFRELVREEGRDKVVWTSGGKGRRGAVEENNR